MAIETLALLGVLACDATNLTVYLGVTWGQVVRASIYVPHGPTIYVGCLVTNCCNISWPVNPIHYHQYLPTSVYLPR